MLKGASCEMKTAQGQTALDLCSEEIRKGGGFNNGNNSKSLRIILFTHEIVMSNPCINTCKSVISSEEPHLKG